MSRASTAKSSGGGAALPGGTTFVTGTWRAGGAVSGGGAASSLSNNQSPAAQQGAGEDKPAPASKATTASGKLGMAQRRLQSDLNQFRTNKNRNLQKIDFPLFAPVQADDGGEAAANASRAARPFTIEAAGDQPLVGEWLAQRKFLFFPRVPPIRGAPWCWALLKSFVLRRDCMADAKSRPWKAAQQQQQQQLQQQQQRNNTMPAATSSSPASAASQPAQQTQQQRQAATPKSKQAAALRSPLPALRDEGGEAAPAVAAPASGGAAATSMRRATTAQLPAHSSPASTTAASSLSLSRVWAGTPSRSLRFSAPQHQQQQQQQRRVDESAGEEGDDEERRRSNGSSSQQRCVSPAVAVLLHEKVDPASNPFVAQLRDKIMNVERRNMWYERFDRSRREERAALSEKRARAAQARNMILEWTWEEDDANNARRREQEERDARERHLAQERLLERALRASDSLGIGGPVVVVDFSYLKLKYFFQLLDARPRNCAVAEDARNAQVGHKKSKLQKLLDAQRKKNDGTDGGENASVAASSPALQEPPVGRASPSPASHDNRNAKRRKSQQQLQQHQEQRHGGTSDYAAAAMSTDATFSELLKLYRTFLAASGAPQQMLDFWKEEDQGIAAVAAAGSPTSSSTPPAAAGSGAAPAASAPSQQQQQQQQQLVLQHFPSSADKVSQRFYTRFLACDFGDETVAPGLLSAAYAFDSRPPPPLPVMHGLKLKGNRFGDHHIVQCPNGNWRSPPGPISAFHDFSFVLDLRCPSWRSTLVSIDLSETCLSELPPELVDIPLLHTLYAHGNRIAKLNDATLVALSETRGEQLLRLSLYENPVVDKLGHRQYVDRLRNMFPMLSHLDNVYLPTIDEAS